MWQPRISEFIRPWPDDSGRMVAQPELILGRRPRGLSTSRLPVIRQPQAAIGELRAIPVYCSLAYSALACFRIGMPGSASLQRARKSLQAAESRDVVLVREAVHCPATRRP